MSGGVIRFRTRADAAIVDAISRAEALSATARLRAREAELAVAQALQLVIRSLPPGSTLSDARTKYLEVAEGLVDDAEAAS